MMIISCPYQKFQELGNYELHVVQVLSYGYELRGWLHETSEVQYLNTHIDVVHVGPEIVKYCTANVQ